MKRRVLVVTEDPAFANDVRDAAGPETAVLTCLGPAQIGCLMDKRGSCALAARSDVALVDSPPTGDFFDHYRGIPSILYAERLARAHPDTQVVLCNAAVRGDHPSAFLPRGSALRLIEQAIAEDQRGEIDEG